MYALPRMLSARRKKILPWYIAFS